MSESINHFYEFGPFRIDRIKRRLLRDRSVVPLTPKAFDTLLVLIEHRAEVVEKDELMEKVWPGLAVEENNLTQNISSLRKALGEKREDPQYILTAPGVGYRFIAEVRSRSSGARALPMSRAPVAAEPDYHSIRSSANPESLPDQRNGWRRPRTVIAGALVIAIGLAGVTYRVV